MLVNIMSFSVANALALHALTANYYHTCHVLSKLLRATIDHYFVASTVYIKMYMYV